MIMPVETDIRTKIIDAARKLVARYGYGKTTMADLAEACGMSPGNLYRYFPGKLDIAEQLAQQAFDEELTALREVVRKQDLSATEKLKVFFCTQLHVTHDKLNEDSKIFEIAEIIKRERPELSNENLKRLRALLTEILASGNASGEFNIPDVVSAAEMIQCATMKYHYPQLFTKLPLNELERELRGVIGLILQGISAGETSGTNAKAVARG
ncbi:MAG: TetR/AcrR family transcriptional regulator [Alphaproteobacteria bacterium]